MASPVPDFAAPLGLTGLQEQTVHPAFPDVQEPTPWHLQEFDRPESGVLNVKMLQPDLLAVPVSKDGLATLALLDTRGQLVTTESLAVRDLQAIQVLTALLGSLERLDEQET